VSYCIICSVVSCGCTEALMMTQCSLAKYYLAEDQKMHLIWTKLSLQWLKMAEPKLSSEQQMSNLLLWFIHQKKYQKLLLKNLAIPVSGSPVSDHLGMRSLSIH